MCGIAGLLGGKGEPSALERQIRSAVSCMHHRGPDDSGVWLNGRGVALGHARLSILDLSQQAHQPMRSPEGRFVMVFNGEIYNYRAIRQDLAARGRIVRGTGDTEVVLAALQEWGVEAVDRFVGMFALALWDEEERVLTLVRDRVGIKPLYYGWDGKTFCFGSELKALREFDHWSPEVDVEAAGEYFQFGYIAAPRTVYRNVFKLEPGCVLRLQPEGEPEVDRYLSLVERIGVPIEGTDGEMMEELEALMADAFQHRMIADVPVGVFLSGGIDSSLVTAILARNNTQQIKTFTIGFQDDAHDESVWARKVAGHLGTEHTEYILRGEEALSMAKNWGDLFDEPFSDSSGIPTLLVSRLAARDVKVVLSADGGDELFSGYNAYLGTLSRWRKLRNIPRLVARAGGAFAGAVPQGILGSGTMLAAWKGATRRRLRRLHSMLSCPTSARCHEVDMSRFLPAEVDRLLGHYASVRQGTDAYPGSFAEQMCLWDFHHYLPDDILVKVDRTTMAASIEGREPLIDHRLVEYAFRLPLDQRRRESGGKHILKKILYGYVPREMVDRPKQGFAIPMQRWLRGELKPLVSHYLSGERLRKNGLLDCSVVTDEVESFYRGNPYAGRRVWALLAFEMWRERWL